MAPIISIAGVSKSFVKDKPVLKNINISIEAGEMVALIGASGSGKSTLIRSIGGLERIDRSDPRNAVEAKIALFGETMQKSGQIAPGAKKLRSRIGIVFQQFNLVPRLSVLTNVCLGLLGNMSSARGTLSLFTKEEKRLAIRALQRVGIAEHARKRGNQLSGGQQQRAAIARTLVQKSEVLVADEPIASLDPASARRVMDILGEINRTDRVTVVVSLARARSLCAQARSFTMAPPMRSPRTSLRSFMVRRAKACSFLSSLIAPPPAILPLSHPLTNPRRSIRARIEKPSSP